ncbi:hypothetical protein PybrP1_008839 [[Pythium] brassicae (nom. inval.)]|nr:hypothetical protein PybrP1_008839 [[Pythium] brassicae (nom. inval.)]
MAYKEREHVEHVLNRLVKRLKSKDAGARQQHAAELAAVVASLARQLSAETYAKVLQQLTPQLYALLQSASEAEQLGGLAAIDLLIDLSAEDQIIRYANYLRNFFTQPNASRAALVAAAAALGHLASTSGVSGTLVAAFVDFEVKRAFEWLQGERPEALFSQRRLAACFVLRELARSAPTLFHVNLTTFFQSIWGAIRDARVEIRAAATEALSACLQLIARRQTRHRVQWYCKVYDQVFEGLNVGRAAAGVGVGVGGAHRAGSASSLTIVAASSAAGAHTSWECVHGSLLVIGELLQHTGGFMVPRFREVCDTVLLYKDAKDKLVNRTVCALLPQLAEFCADAFVRHYLPGALAHLLKRLTTHASAAERGIVFLALGRLALAVGPHVLPQLPAIVKLVKDALPTHARKKKNKLFCVESLTCVAHLSRALGAAFEKHLFDDLLESMMQNGLSDALLDALTVVVASIPNALPTVQERLLNEISGILRGVPFSSASGDSSSGAGSGGSDHGHHGHTGSDSGDAAAYADKPPAKPSGVFALFSSMKRGSIALAETAGLTSAAAARNGDDDSGSGVSTSAASASSTAAHALLIKGDTGDEIDIILLSLRTLSCFDFSGNFCLLPFVRDCVALYLKNPDARIRKQAVVTCSKLLLPSAAATTTTTTTATTTLSASVSSSVSGLPLPLACSASGWSRVTARGPSGRVIDHVLTQLLQVGAADMDVLVRKSVVESLDARFDALLSQEAHLTVALTFLNDESSEIRERAMALLARLAPRNPAFVIPALRRVLIQLLTELAHTPDARMKEESTRLLGRLIRGAQHLVDPYIARVLEVLLPTLVQGHATLASAVLATLGELALVAQTQLGAYEHYLFPLIIRTLQDHSSVEKRQVALQTLGQLAGSTGSVIRPYLASPKLLEVLLSLLQHSAATPWPLRREAMKTIGILGALDPYKYKLCISRASLQEANDAASEPPPLASTAEPGAEPSTTTTTATATTGGSVVQYHYPKLDLDLKALGVTIDFAGFNTKLAGEVLDEKQQIELQLFTAAPIGTRRQADTGSSRSANAASAADASFVPGGGGGAGSQSTTTATAATTTSLSSAKKHATSVYSDDAFDFESSLLDAEMELDPTELSPASDAYFPTVAIHALLRILKEPSLSVHHHGVIQAVMFIFKSLSTQCVPFLKYILPPFLRVLARGEPRLRESLFLQLTTLITIVSSHMKPFFPPIMALALRFWHAHLAQIVRLLETIAQAAPREFRAEYFPKLLPKVLEVLQPHPEVLFDMGTMLPHGDSSDLGMGMGMAGGVGAGVGLGLGLGAGSSGLAGSPLRELPGGAMNGAGGSSAHAGAHHHHHKGGGEHHHHLAHKPGGRAAAAAIQVQVVQSLIVFRDAVEEYVYLLVPALARLMESVETPLDVKVMAVYAFARICTVAQFENYAGARLLQPFARVAKQISAKGSHFFSRAASGAGTSSSNHNSSNSTGGAGGSSAGSAGSAPAAVAATRAEAAKFADVMLYALCAMAYQLQHELLTFEPLVLQILASLPAQHEPSTLEAAQLVLQALETLRRGDSVALSLLDAPVFRRGSVRAMGLAVEAAAAGGAGAAAATGAAASTAAPSPHVRLHVNQQNLRRAWEASQRSTKEDWSEWMRRFSIELLRESPSAALRSCCALAQAYNPLARALFNPAFVSCWNELYEQYQDYLVRALETAFQSDTIPAEILQTLLNLAEFMEHDVEALPIDIRELGELAQKCHAYAKALHYKELEFHTSPSTCIEALISINNQLGQPEAAVGILKYAQQHHQSVIQVKETWFEKLQDWRAALALYDRKLRAADPTTTAGAALDVHVAIGKMRCLEALGEWEQLAALADTVWKHLHAQQQAATPPPPRRAPPLTAASRLLTRVNSSSSSSGMHASLLRASSFSGSSSGAGGLAGAGAGTSSSSADDTEENALQKVAMLGARASWCLSQWENMSQYIAACAPSPPPSSRGVSVSSLSLSSSPLLSVAAGSDEEDTQTSLFRSVLAVHHGRFDEAAVLIDETRRTLDTKLGALVGESYSRAYRSVVTLQQLSELEEVITYKKLRLHVATSEDAARYKRHMVRMWQTRLGGCKQSVEVWQQILAVRALVLAPRDDIDTWLQFASLCRQSGNLSLSLRVFTNSLGVNLSGSLGSGALSDLLSSSSSSSSGAAGSLPSFGYGEKEHHRVAFAYLKHLWAVGEKTKALAELHHLVATIASRNNSSNSSHHRVPGAPFSHGLSSGPGSGEEELLVKCHLKMAEWQLDYHEQQLERVSIPSVLSSLQLCTELEPRSYKAWHAWALMNFHVVEHFSQLSSSSSSAGGAAAPVPPSLSASASGVAPTSGVGGIGPYIAPAIHGFFRSIALGRSRWAANVQQDVLRVLTLWFAHGSRADVLTALDQGFKSVSIETWLIVIPQLIARIHTPCAPVQTQLRRLLCAVGAQHPHALIYPLSVALKSPLAVRQQAAHEIMKKLCEKYEAMVGEALLVSHELIRVAILWHEMWFNGLEEASRLWFGEKDLDGMVAVLAPLHELMENGPQTMREVGFQQAFGRDLREAHEWLQRFLSNRHNDADLNRAWDLYYHVFRRISKQVTQVTSLELQYVSPNLLKARHLQLAVPGTYRAGHAVVKIDAFLPTVLVIASKQHPRRITMRGSNGLEYMFLLKGHEDLRLDERVTQLFGLVNALLINDRQTSKKDLKIHRYPVIPLSHNAGIVGWLAHCDTLHQLIRDYRDGRKILLNIEHRLMLQMAPDYDALTLVQKVEVFEYALENTAGQDLYKVLWLKSENSEMWLDRRTNYTRSLAVMSMVGYILGLGDRHPSNLMLHRFSGTIVHIDFGDCFEVAMDREKYPEKIPFRLTRMLTNAMEVSGIEGTFRYSCESVMHVLRENQHSLMAMLEAFVDDPLIGWRLLAPTTVSPSKAGGGGATGGAGAAASVATRATMASSVRTAYQQPLPVVDGAARRHPRSESISIPEAAAPTVAPHEAVERAHVSAKPVAAHEPAAVVVAAPPRLVGGSTSDTAAPAPVEAVSVSAPTVPQSTADAPTESDLQDDENGDDDDDDGDNEEHDESGADTDGSDVYDEEDEEEDDDGYDDGEDRGVSDEEYDDDDDDDEQEEKAAGESQQAAAALPAAAAQVAMRTSVMPSSVPKPIRGGIVGSAMASVTSRASAIPSSRLPPRPSTSVASSRPMSISKSIAFTRRVPPSMPRGGGSGGGSGSFVGARAGRDASASNGNPDDDNDDDEKLERIDYERTNLHHVMSSLASSVSNVGQGSLTRRFLQTKIEVANTVASGDAAEATDREDSGLPPPSLVPPQQRSAGAPPPPPPPPTPGASAVVGTAGVGGGVVRAKQRRNSMSQQIPPSSDRATTTATTTTATTTTTTTTATATTTTQVAQSQAKSDVHANRSHRERELVQMLGPEGTGAPREALNEKAVAVIRRVQAKLTGRDFEGEREPLGVSAQVQRLIDQAASHENLCQSYIGWCPFW